MINHEKGGRGVGAPCYFCTAGLFVDILHHLTSAHEAEINLKFAEHCEIVGAMTKDQFKQRLANKASWFRDRNYPSWWLQNGVLMPQKIDNVVVAVDPCKIIFCSFCFLLLGKADWDVHCSECHSQLASSNPASEKTGLRCGTSKLYNLSRFLFLLAVLSRLLDISFIFTPRRRI